MKKAVHIVGAAIAILAVYDMVAPGVSTSLPSLPQVPTSNNLTNLVIGGALFAVPLFF